MLHHTSTAFQGNFLCQSGIVSSDMEVTVHLYHFLSEGPYPQVHEHFPFLTYIGSPTGDVMHWTQYFISMWVNYCVELSG